MSEQTMTKDDMKALAQQIKTIADELILRAKLRAKGDEEVYARLVRKDSPFGYELISYQADAIANDSKQWDGNSANNLLLQCSRNAQIRMKYLMEHYTQIPSPNIQMFMSNEWFASTQ